MALAVLIALGAFPMISAFADEPIVVTTGEELDAALKTLVGAEADVTINLANNIDAITSATYAGYATGAKLTINGNGYTIDGKGAAKSGLRFGARGQSIDLVLNNTVFANMRNEESHGGGAIGNWRGNIEISGCTFIGNAVNNAEGTMTRGNGGAVMLQSTGAMNVSNSTFIGNVAPANGGAIQAPAGVLNNITVVGNSAGTGIGGVNGAFTVTNSIISGNTTASETADANVGTTVVYAEGNNVVGVDTAAWLASALDETNTLALLDVADSPAVDKANPETATIADQRGIVRDATPDIGAYELVKIPVPDANVLGLAVNPDLSANGVSGLSLVANLAADQVNLIEATLKYNTAQVTASATLNPAFASAAVSKITVDAEKGLIHIVVGVAGSEAIAADGLTSIADVVLTSIDGAIGGSHISISKCATYAAGSAVESALDPSALYARFTYAPKLDANVDGKLDAADLSYVLFIFGATSADANWNDIKTGDLNGDGAIDMADISILVDALYA